MRGRTLLFVVIFLSSELSHAQSLINNLQVYGGTLNVHVQQVGGATFGGYSQSAIVDGDNLNLNISQFGSNSIHTNLHVRDEIAGTSLININQGNSSKFVSNSQIDLTVGQKFKATSQRIEINQTGSGAYASVSIANIGPVANVDIKAVQEENSTLNMYLLKGNNQNVSVLQSANAIANIINNGNNFQTKITQAPDSTVNISNTGNFNTYSVSTQKTGDIANLTIYGNNNQFTFDFNTYKSVSIKTTPSQSINGGNFMVGPLNTLFDANNIASNINAAANAIVIKR